MLVLPHEISVVNEEHYEDLQAEMGDWVEEDNADAAQEFDTSSTDRDPHDDPVDDATTVEGGGVEGAGGSVDGLDGSTATKTGSRLGGVIQSMIRAVVQGLAGGKWYLVNFLLPSHSDLPKTIHDVEVLAHVSTGTQQDHGIVAVATEASFALVTRSDASVDKDDSAEDVEKARKAHSNDDPSNFAHFDVVQSPPDHHYLDIMDQGSSGGKVWVRAVQKEWKILENNLPDTIYVRVYEDCMDLLGGGGGGGAETELTEISDGLFFFDLQLPPSYPDMPPQVYYHSFGLRLNPNLDESGTLCLSLLDTFGGEGTELWSYEDTCLPTSRL
ncbi:hypothetical protein ACQ4PT_002341 [Festuca glaucescens]